MKKFEYKGKQWHEQCFCCKVCLQPIGNKSFIPRDQEVVCVQCYEEQYAQRCMKCNGVSSLYICNAVYSIEFMQPQIQGQVNGGRCRKKLGVH